MKKFLITGVLCFLVGLSFGQKKAVSAAKNEIKGNTPNFVEARSLIKGALENPETANEAETWYVAGQIENNQFDKEREMEILGKKPNEEVMYNALGGILPYFLKAAELDQLPDAKGKVKPKFLKDIRSIIRANRPFYVNAGIYAYDNKDYKKAYENFKLFGDIPNMSLYNDEKWTIAEGDTTELQIRYYAGLAASLIPDDKAAIAIYEEIKDKGYNENDIYRNLATIYNQLEDSVNFERIIKDGFVKFPENEYFMLNMINLSINSGKSKEAISYLEKAIAQQPGNAQLYDVLGQVYEQDKNSDEAILNMKKALEIDPNNIDFLSHIGRVYFNLGVEKRGESDATTDLNRSSEILKQSLDYFKQSMPFFEKIFELDPKNSGAIFALRSIYYSLGMPEYEKMDALYNANE